MADNVRVYAMFCGVKRSKIWESEVQRASCVYCARRAERSDSGGRVQRALRIFEKFIHIIPFLVDFLLLYLIFILKNYYFPCFSAGTVFIGLRPIAAHAIA